MSYSTAQALFNAVRVDLDDQEENHFTDAVLVVPYNRLHRAINKELIQIGAEVAMGQQTISTDGTNYVFPLPTDFLALVENSFRPRSPIDATSDFTFGDPMPQVSPHDPRMQRNPTTTKTPSFFAMETGSGASSTGDTYNGTARTIYNYGRPDSSAYLVFNCFPPASQYYDYRYYQTTTDVTSTSISNTVMPFGNLLDDVFHASLAIWCRDHREFTSQSEQSWMTGAVDGAIMVLGLRHLHEREMTPSTWQGFPEW